VGKLILVADIGGTNARFAIAHSDGAVLTVRDAQTFRAEDFETIRDAADAYLEAVSEKPEVACFAAAGPVTPKGVDFTNSHWALRPDEIKIPLRLKAFHIVNDFYALAAGVSALPQDAFEAVKPGTPDPEAPVLVIGPGTGLGQALIVPTPLGERVVATEGGHVTFAPRTQEEIDADTPRVSLQANEITKAAIEGTYPIAMKAVDMFCAVLGRVAGDAVLATGARGGVVLGGGILPKIRDVFLASQFVEKFCEKGRMRPYVEAVPVRMIITEGAALYGAAAAFLAAERHP